MIGRLLRYLFPRRSLRQSLPLATRQWSSQEYPGSIPAEFQDNIALLRMAGLARTDADGYRLIRKFNKAGVTDIRQIMKAVKRQRRSMPRWERAKKRFKRLL